MRGHKSKPERYAGLDDDEIRAEMESFEERLKTHDLDEIIAVSKDISDMSEMFRRYRPSNDRVFASIDRLYNALGVKIAELQQRQIDMDAMT